MALTQIADAGLKTPASDLQDNAKIVLGTGNDLEIYHDGSHSFIKDSGQGNLKVLGSNLSLKNTADDKAYIDCIDAGAVEIYHNGTKKLETVSVGASVTGNLGIDTTTPAAALDFGVTSVNENVIHLRKNSNSIIGFGVSSGYGVKAFAPHDITSTDAIFETGTIGSDGSTYTQEGIQVLNNGNLVVNSGDVTLADGKKLKLGASDDLLIYHDSGGDSYIQDKAGGNLYITAHDLIIQNNDTSETLAKFIEDGGVELYHDNSEKIRTTSTGFKTLGNAQFDDNRKVEFGDGQDLQIFHDGTNSNISNATGTLKIGCSNNIEINTFDGHAAAKFINDGAVELYYNNTKTFETTSVGASVTGYLLATRAGTVAKFDKSDTGDNDGIQMRHARGGLSGYSGKMISFRGNDDTEEGNITIGTSATAYNTESDYRLKENEVAISDGITRLKTLKPYRFNFKKDPDVTVDGFFAHEVSSILPNAIFGEKDAVESDGTPKYQSIDHSKFVPLLTAALQEAITKIETLETKVAALEAA